MVTENGLTLHPNFFDIVLFCMRVLGIGSGHCVAIVLRTSKVQLALGVCLCCVAITCSVCWISCVSPWLAT